MRRNEAAKPRPGPTSSTRATASRGVTSTTKPRGTTTAPASTGSTDKADGTAKPATSSVRARMAAGGTARAARPTAADRGTAASRSTTTRASATPAAAGGAAATKRVRPGLASGASRPGAAGPKATGAATSSTTTKRGALASRSAGANAGTRTTARSGGLLSSVRSGARAIGAKLSPRGRTSPRKGADTLPQSGSQEGEAEKADAANGVQEIAGVDTEAPIEQKEEPMKEEVENGGVEVEEKGEENGEISDPAETETSAPTPTVAEDAEARMREQVRRERDELTRKRAIEGESDRNPHAEAIAREEAARLAKETEDEETKRKREEIEKRVREELTREKDARAKEKEKEKEKGVSPRVSPRLQAELERIEKERAALKVKEQELKAVIDADRGTRAQMEAEDERRRQEKEERERGEREKEEEQNREREEREKKVREEKEEKAREEKEREEKERVEREEKERLEREEKERKDKEEAEKRAEQEKAEAEARERAETEKRQQEAKAKADQQREGGRTSHLDAKDPLLEAGNRTSIKDRIRQLSAEADHKPSESHTSPEAGLKLGGRSGSGGGAGGLVAQMKALAETRDALPIAPGNRKPSVKFQMGEAETNKCPQCEKTVYIAEAVVDGKGVQFHKNCFKCGLCRQSLVGRQYGKHKEDGLLYCNVPPTTCLAQRGVDVNEIVKGEIVTGAVKESAFADKRKSVKDVLKSNFVGDLERSIGGMIPKCGICGGVFKTEDKVVTSGIQRVHEDCAKSGKAMRAQSLSLRQAQGLVPQILTCRIFCQGKWHSFILITDPTTPASQDNDTAVYKYLPDPKAANGKEREIQPNPMAQGIPTVKIDLTGEWTSYVKQGDASVDPSAKLVSQSFTKPQTEIDHSLTLTFGVDAVAGRVSSESAELMLKRPVGAGDGDGGALEHVVKTRARASNTRRTRPGGGGSGGKRLSMLEDMDEEDFV